VLAATRCIRYSRPLVWQKRPANADAGMHCACGSAWHCVLRQHHMHMSHHHMAARCIAYCGSIICICHIITWQRIALRILVLAFGMQHRKEGEARRGDGGNKLKATEGKEREGRRREQMRGEAKGRDKRREEGREGDGAEGGACTHGACKHTHTHTHTQTHISLSLLSLCLPRSFFPPLPPPLTP